jgi:hypothetical protein
MKIKSFKNFINESIKYSSKLIELEELPNGLKISLTKEGMETALEDGLTEDNFDEYFEEIQSNSEYIYHYDLGQSGFGLTEAPGITLGYGYDDNGEFTDEGNDDSEVYYFNEYQIESFVDKLIDKGFVIFQKA